MSLERWLLGLFLVLLPLCASSATAPAPQRAPELPADVRLYALDCGRAEIADMSAFGDEAGPRELVASCYVIRHPRGTLLWDTGVNDTFAETRASS
ncbi:hypothetical protein [Sorangium sp. So ce1078]|uniref:hypothetical protein n=1 Tax=Sorangium sp. So ce1078 TaxID=3133329 RepID=UPI003F621DA3